MSDGSDAPLDWDAFWREASESARDTARPGRFDKPDQFRRFFDSRGVPATFGSVGCGPADAEFALARRHPDTESAVTTPPSRSSPRTASERAIRDLYDLVTPGGHLVFDYPNRHTRVTYRELLPEEVPDEGRFEERWRLVLDGENLLSHERIHGVLGTWPRSFYAGVGRENPPRDSPCVFVPK